MKTETVLAVLGTCLILHIPVLVGLALVALAIVTPEKPRRAH